MFLSYNCNINVIMTVFQDVQYTIFLEKFNGVFYSISLTPKIHYILVNINT